jgi:RNA polymerase sigma-70 factor (ECF subfamily)
MNEFGRLLEKEIPRLRRYAFALTRNMSRADDLVQDTLVRAIAKQRGWQCGTNLRAWLFTLMHNQNVNGVRRSAREGAVEFDDTWPFPTAATDPAAGLSLRDLDRALARIPQERRQVILLIGLEDISYKEAATILDVPIGTIRSRLSRGRESLRILMDRTHATEPVNRAAITSAPSKPKRFVPGFERTQNSHLLQLMMPSARLGLAAVTAGLSEHGVPDLASPAWFDA